MKHVLINTLCFLIGVALLQAHQDTSIRLENSKLVGLPEEFQPAEFDLKKKILTVSGKRLEFPESLQALFPDEQIVDHFGEPNALKGVPYTLNFSASWYHGPSLLPPYLLITITPKDRDFRSEIIVDIEEVEFLDAHVFLKISEERAEMVPVLIDRPSPPKPQLDDWLSIIGKWRSGSTIFEITENHIHATNSGEVMDYPKGEISPKEPGVMLLKLPNGDQESFVYERKGDILELGFEGAGGIGLAKLGSAADKAYQRRNKQAEQGDTE